MITLILTLATVCLLGFVAIKYTPLSFVYSYFIKPRKKVKGTIQQQYLAGQRYFVFLPKGYDPKDEKKYQVIFHLHGAMPFGPKTSLSIIKKDVNYIANLHEKMVAEGTSSPAIIVAPYDGIGMSMWSDDWQNMVSVEQDFIKTLIPYIQSSYNVFTSRENTTIHGFSMGGFGATKLGFKYPELFGKIVSLDGAIHNWETLSKSRKKITYNVFRTEDQFNESSPWILSEKYAKQQDKFPLEIFIVRAWVKEYNNNFRKHLQDLGVDFTFIETSCQHDVSCMLGNEKVSIAYRL